MKHIFTNNFAAKLVSLVLATLLWAVIKRSQINEPLPLEGTGKYPAASGGFKIEIGPNGK